MGRLIDANKAIKDMQYYHDDCAQTSEYTRLGFETAMEVVKSAPTIEAIPKADYKARLKADMVAMLTELKKEIEEQCKIPNNCESAYDWENGVYACYKVVKQKIEALKEQTDRNDSK